MCGPTQNWGPIGLAVCCLLDTNKQTDTQAKLFIDLNLFCPENNGHQSKRLPVLG